MRLRQIFRSRRGERPARGKARGTHLCFSKSQSGHGAQGKRPIRTSNQIPQCHRGSLLEKLNEKNVTS